MAYRYQPVDNNTDTPAEGITVDSRVSQILAFLRGISGLPEIAFSSEIIVVAVRYYAFHNIRDWQ